MKNNVVKLDNHIIRNDILNQKLQIFEVKQFGELEAYYKRQCQKALGAYKAWKREYAGETDAIQLLYGQLDGIILRHHAVNAVQAYWIIRQDYQKIFHTYLNALPTYQGQQAVGGSNA